MASQAGDARTRAEADSNQLVKTATLDFGSTAVGTSTDLTISVPGAAVGDIVALGIPNGSIPTNASYTAWVSATDTVKVRFVSHTGTQDPASGTFKVAVLKFPNY